MSNCMRFASAPRRATRLPALRLAILNWLYCRRLGGRFQIRVECDEPAAVQPSDVRDLFRCLDWLTLDATLAPEFQSANAARYVAAAEALLSSGAAYQDPMAKGAVAFRAVNRNTTLVDLVRGALDRSQFETRDLLILRADGTATAAFADIVDDLAAGVTHVIRDEAELALAFVQGDIARALGESPPLYAHVPTLLDVGGKELRMSDEDEDVMSLRAQGYLPMAVLAYLGTIGRRTSDLGGSSSKAELAENFELSALLQAPPRLEPSRLEWLNGECLRGLPVDELARSLRMAMGSAGADLALASPSYTADVMHFIRGSGKTITDLSVVAAPFFSEAFTVDPTAAKLHLTQPIALGALDELADRLGRMDDFSVASIERALKQTALTRQLRPSMLAYSVRVAISGQLMGPDLAAMMVLLGLDRATTRLRRAAATPSTGA